MAFEVLGMNEAKKVDKADKVRKAIFITIRKDSSRLTDKAVRDMYGSKVMEMIIKRAKLAKSFDEIIVCTTTRDVDDEIEQISLNMGVKAFRGSLMDKLERWNGAAKEYDIDYIVTFDGDDLFCEPKLLDKGAEQIERRGLDFIEAPQGLICGAFTYAFTAKALSKVCDIKDTDDTEMMWTYFKDTGLFKTGVLEDVDPIYFNDGIRCTLDYPEDYEFFSRVFEHFDAKDNDVGLDKIAEWLNDNPKVAKINIGRQQEFLDNQKKRTHLELKEA